MAIFKDAKVAKDLFLDLWTKLIEESDFGPEIRDNNLSISFIITNPDIKMYVDADGVKFNEDAAKMNAIVTMSMDGDDVHKFWLKKLNIPKAIATRKVKTKGPISKVLKFMPLLKPGYLLYPGYCKKFNLPTDI